MSASAPSIEVMQSPWLAGLQEATTKLSLVKLSESSDPKNEIPKGQSDEESQPTQAPGEEVPSESISATTIQEEELPDLSALPKPQLDPAEFAAMQLQASNRKRWSQNAGIELCGLETEHRKLQEMKMKDPEIVLSPKYVQREKELNGAIAKIGSVGEDLKVRVAFSKLIETLRRCDGTLESEVAHLIKEVIAMGRYRQATTQDIDNARRAKGWPHKSVFYKKWYLSVPPPPPSPGHNLLEYELDKLARRAMRAINKRQATEEKQRAEREANKIVAMKQRGGNRATSGILAVEAGTYYLTENTGKDVGHALVEVYIHASQKLPPELRLIESCGSLSWMTAEGEWDSLPLYWITANKVYSRERLSDFREVLTLTRELRALIDANVKMAAAIQG